MNIFFLDPDFTKNAQYHVDKHCGKMILETAQLLATAYPKGVAPYKITHYNHPTAKWIRESMDNFNYAIKYAKALGTEFAFRRKKVHKSELVINWYMENDPNIPSIGATDPPRAFAKFKGMIPETTCVYTDYRVYYNEAKRHLFKWSQRPVPEWVENFTYAHRPG